MLDFLSILCNKPQTLKMLLRTSYAGMCCAVFIALALLLWWLDRWAIGVDAWAHMGWKTVMANAFPALVMAVFLGAVSGRFICSAIIVSGVFSLLYVASEIKFQTLGETVVLQDRYFLQSMNADSIKLFMPYLGDVSTLMLIGWPILALLLFTALFWLEGKIAALTIKIRALVAVPSVLLMCAIIIPAWPVNAIYTKSLMQLKLEYEPMIAVFRGGLFSNIMYQHAKKSGIDLSVDEGALAEQMAHLKRVGLWPYSPAHEMPPMQGQGQPDIIVVLSESFMDPHVISGMDALPDIIPNFRRIAAHSSSGLMQVPTYGGGTVRTEFEVMTGMPLKAFADVTFPYPDLPLNHLSGLATVLGARGYHTFALHANNWRFWERSIAYPAMGFADLKPLSLFTAHGHKDGIWYSDESMTNILLQQLQHEQNAPVFAFVLSMQAHGPYTVAKESIRDQPLYDSLELPPLSKDADAAFRTYLYHIHAADRALGRLVDALEVRGRPYRLLFFGDHLPGLSQVWSELRFSDGQAAHKQKVPWLIAGSDIDSSQHIGYSWQLPSAMLEGTGLMAPAEYLAFTLAISKAACCSGNDLRTLPDNPALHAAAHANVTGTWERYAPE